VPDSETAMAEFSSTQPNRDYKKKPTLKAIKSRTLSGYGYKAVNEILDHQINQ
jgi:hypothetical protein